MCDRAQKTLDWYTARFEREYRDAEVEYARLCELFKDVCWYHFETQCKTWRAPWRGSDSVSAVELLAMRFERHWSRDCLMEHGRFPVYYRGPLHDAPPLPPQIVYKELCAAREYMEHCKTQTTAAYDWAPGGGLYEGLRRTTLVGALQPVQCVYRKRKFSHGTGSDV